MTTGIVIAKGNSGRLPGKNMLEFCGHPLTAWSIVQSVNSVLIDKTYLSTDSEEIAEMGRKYGAEIMWRDWEPIPREEANIPFCHAIRLLQQGEGIDEVVPLLPTSPTRLPDDLDNMIRLKRQRGVREIGTLTPHNEAIEYEIIGENLATLVLFDRSGNYATQGGATAVVDADHYLEVADFPACVWSWKEAKELRGKNTKVGKFLFREISFYPVKIWQAEDIDYQVEFEFVELIMKHFVLKGRGIEIYEEYREREEKRIYNDFAGATKDKGPVHN